VNTLPETYARALAALASGAVASGAAASGAAASGAAASGAALIPVPTRVAIAYSGGLDSSALLDLAQRHAQTHAITLYAFHIHHGISPNADAWLLHCEHTCAERAIHFDARRVTFDANDKHGTEAAARKARYGALGELCRTHGVQLLLTAHHQDDQAETVLLQLLRGSGVAGLSGMDDANGAPELLANADVVMARPLLSASRRQLAAHVAEYQLGHVEDESNDDPRYARNALRHQVMPALALAFPGFQQRFARSAQHAQATQRLLTELGEQDLTHCLDGDAVDIGKLRLLSQDRSYNLLRHWFAKRHLRMPSTAWLAQMLTQLLSARADAQLLIAHPECDVRRYRDRLYLMPKRVRLPGMPDPDDEAFPGHGWPSAEMQDRQQAASGQTFHWQGEAQIAFFDYGGVLHFDRAESGFDAQWLREQPLTIDFRKGGERLKLAANRPTRALKYHYQACDVPAWERPRLPLVSNSAALLFVAGVGMDSRHLSAAGAPCIALRWVANPD
jgi:tRNA(Ile)-lysidine synthase